MNEDLARVHAELGRPRTNLVWAKAELFLGLSAAGIAIAIAMAIGDRATSQPRHPLRRDRPVANTVVNDAAESTTGFASRAASRDP